VTKSTAKTEGYRIEVTAKEVDEARAAISARLRQAIIGFKHAGEPGRISGLMGDLRALDFIDPAKSDAMPAPAPRVDPKVAERQAAAADDALMQVQNRQQALKERREAEKEEGITDGR
jgi:hypothetical protein